MRLISTINCIKKAAFQIRIPIRFFKNFERILEQTDFIHWKTCKVLATQLLQSDISDGFRILLIFTNSDRNSHWKSSLLCLLYFREHIHSSIFDLFVKDSHKKCEIYKYFVWAWKVPWFLLIIFPVVTNHFCLRFSFFEIVSLILIKFRRYSYFLLLCKLF